MSTPKRMQDGRFFVNEGFTTAGSRAQPKLMLGRDEAAATIRAALIEKLWLHSVDIAREFGEPEVWDSLGLHIARQVALGEKVIDVKTDSDDDMPEIAVGLLSGWQDCVPGIKIRLVDQKAEENGREVRRSQAQRLRDHASEVIAGGGNQRLHEAIGGYIKAVRQHKPYQLGNGNISEWAGAKIRQAEFCRLHLPDLRLDDLDTEQIDECLSILAARPCKRTPSGNPTNIKISKVSASNTIKEFRAFLRWIHRAKEWEWQKPRDYEVTPIRIKGDVRKGPIRVQTYDIAELSILWQYATPWERCLMVLALNAGFGMAEVCSLCKQEVFINQLHPYARELRINSTDADSWIMRQRRKTDVYAEWQLWPITIQAINWLQANRPQTESECVVLTKKGKPLKIEGKRNTQIANAWKRLLKRIRDKDKPEFRPLSFNKLRKTGSNWIRSHYGKELADLFLGHGEPVGEDVVAAYTNPRFAALHKVIGDFGATLEPVFASVAEPFPPKEKLGGANISLGTIQAIKELAEGGMKPGMIAEKMNISRETVRRRLKD